MSVFDIFSAKPAPAQQAAPTTPAASTQPAPAAPAKPEQSTQQSTQQLSPALPGNITTPTQPVTLETPVTAPNGVVPAAEPNTVTPDAPLAQFATLWDTVPNTEDPSAAPTPLSAETLQKTMANVNFAEAIAPETMTAITAGGEDAQKAFSAAMNTIARQVMVQSTLVNNKLTEQAIASAAQKYEANLPALLRSQTASDHLKTTNPLFSNPAIKPVIGAVQAALLQKHPNATPAELTIHGITRGWGAGRTR